MSLKPTIKGLLAAIFAIIAALGIVINPELQAEIISGVLAIVGIISYLVSEPKEDD